MSAIIKNQAGESITLSHEVAKKESSKYVEALELAGAGENPPEGSEPVVLEELDCDKTGLEVIEEYIKLPENERTAIPKPLTNMNEKANFNEKELALMKKAEKAGQLPQLVIASTSLGLHHFSPLVSAYVACRIDAIAKEGPTILAAAEKLRTFLNIPNDWTPEEMKHLEKEMEYAKSVDPNVY